MADIYDPPCFDLGFGPVSVGSIVYLLQKPEQHLRVSAIDMILKTLDLETLDHNLPKKVGTFKWYDVYLANKSKSTKFEIKSTNSESETITVSTPKTNDKNSLIADLWNIYLAREPHHAQITAYDVKQMLKFVEFAKEKL